jgi:hypothetical protein
MGSFLQELREATGAKALLGGRRIPDFVRNLYEFIACFTLFYILFGGKAAETRGSFAAQFFFCWRKSIKLIEDAMMPVMPKG